MLTLPMHQRQQEKAWAQHWKKKLKKSFLSQSHIVCTAASTDTTKQRTHTHTYCTHTPHTHTHTHLCACSSMVLLISSAGIWLTVPVQLPQGLAGKRIASHTQLETVAFSSSEAGLAVNTDYTAQNMLLCGRFMSSSKSHGFVFMTSGPVNVQHIDICGVVWVSCRFNTHFTFLGYMLILC